MAARGTIPTAPVAGADQPRTTPRSCPLKKTLRFDTADFPNIPGKIEGMALLPDGALVLINDDDFGITGARTQIVVVRGLTFGEQR